METREPGEELPARGLILHGVLVCHSLGSKHSQHQGSKEQVGGVPYLDKQDGANHNSKTFSLGATQKSPVFRSYWTAKLDLCCYVVAVFLPQAKKLCRLSSPAGKAMATS